MCNWKELLYKCSTLKTHYTRVLLVFVGDYVIAVEIEFIVKVEKIGLIHQKLGA